jgi:hypothetical protein
MKHRYILAIDPSGAFHEGKGTTGWCLFDAAVEQTKEIGMIQAYKFETDCAYWRAHTDLLDRMRFDYHDVIVIIEDYLLYAHKATAQINSKFETSQLIGILKLHLSSYKTPYKIRTAASVKKRWANYILIRKGYLTSKKGCFSVNGLKVNKHMLDALRHAVHEAAFYNN